jgi:hypothetical protein
MRDRKLKLIAMVREPSPNISRLILLYKEQLSYKYCLNHFVRYLTCKSKDGLQTQLVRQLHFPRPPFFMIEMLIDVFRIDERDNTIQSCKFLHSIAGSATPVVSIIMPSSFNVPFLTRSASFSSTFTKSWRTVQQIQPFIVSIISSSLCIFVFFCKSARRSRHLQTHFRSRQFSFYVSRLRCD